MIRARPVICGALERRTLFAVSVSTFTDPDSGALGLRVTGDAAADDVFIQDDPGVGVFVSGTGLPLRAFAGDVELWDVRTGGGDDEIEWGYGGGMGNNRSIFVDLGAGHDRLNYVPGTIEGGSAVLLDVVAGGGNDDLFVGAPSGVGAGSRYLVQVDAGGGDDDVDTFVSGVGGVGAGAEFDVELGAGRNRFTGRVDRVGPDGAAAFRIKGGDSTGTLFDAATLEVPESVDGDLLFEAYLGAGDDVATASFGADGDVFSGLRLNARINLQGQSGNDALAVRTNQGFDFQTVSRLLDVTLAGGAGNDTLNVDLRNTPSTGDDDGLELAGRLRVRQHGQAGNDTLQTDLLFTGTSTGFADVIVTGDSGNDRAAFGLRDRSAGAVSYVGRFALLDGGADFDTRAGIVTNVPNRLRVQRFDAGPGIVVVVI